MDSSENVARLLKDIWVSGGEIAPAAFTLRPNLHETYISVLREQAPTFRQDALDISHKKIVRYASVNAEELVKRNDSILKENVTYSIKAIDNNKYKSHAGVFVAINGHNIVGGEPFQQYIRQRGVAEDMLLIGIAERLAYISRNNIKKLS